MPGVMDIKHLLCHPTDPYLAPPKPQEPVIDRMPYNSSPEYDYCSRDYWHNNNNCRGCRSNSVSSIQSNCSSMASPPSLVRSRTTSDASSQASASPREWAYPATPRDEDTTMIRLGYEPYYLVPHTPSVSTGSCNMVGRYRAPSHGSRRSRSTSASSVNAPVQTRMAWTPTEDDLLQQGYDEGLSWAMISATYLPHRSRGCCWGRFKTLQSKNLVDPKRQNARLFRRPWKAVDGAKRQQPH
ncbi:hypothetical protein BJV82DRAFT_574844 [Fennellomyces sp. T-0311]|nr:hypothetical protein BJV82DRAFT_574844 [Fennellomyces sp. T-0311]